VSLAGLIGKPVINQARQQIGKVADVVAPWDSHQSYPPVTGLTPWTRRPVGLSEGLLES
jgi:hypothetical protein